MADDPQVDVAQTVEATAMQDASEPTDVKEPSGSDQSVTQKDIARLQRKYDRLLAQARKELDVERRSRQTVEQQMNQLLDTAERKFLDTLTPEKRAEWTAAQKAKEAQRLSAELQGLRQQQTLDKARDKVLREYGLRGNEEGLDYSSWQKFTHSAAKLHAASVVKSKLNELEQTKSKRQEAVAQAQEAVAQRPVATPPVVDSRGTARVIPSNGPLTESDFRNIQLSLTKGSANQRANALKALRERRESVRAA